jgi:tight adherence protein B
MLLSIAIFIIGFGAVVGGYWAFTELPGYLAARRMNQRILDLSVSSDSPGDDASVVKKSGGGPLPGLDKLVARVGATASLGTLIEQSGLKTTASSIVLTAIVLAAVAGVATYLFVPISIMAPLVAALAASLPFLYLMRKRTLRLRAFEEMFPEALDLLSRALRAGHAFQTAMGMVGEELKEPVGPEFKKTFEQQNFGLPLRDALQQFTERVPLLDVRFFVTAVLIQRDTGGNLSEILDNLGHVVRERFKIIRQVRVHTAHGRFTAFVLLSLPPALGIALTLLNPEHMQLLFSDKMGQMMLLVALIMQAIGFVWIRKVIKIEV